MARVVAVMHAAMFSIIFLNVDEILSYSCWNTPASMDTIFRSFDARTEALSGSCPISKNGKAPK